MLRRSGEGVVEGPLSGKLRGAEELFVGVLLVDVDAFKVVLDQAFAQELGAGQDLSLGVARVEDK